MNYWLMKSEPDAFSIDDLAKCDDQTEPWDGIRNYQARNFMRDQMKIGDKVLFYHSSCKVPGVVGIAKVVKEAYPDHTSWDQNSKYFDPKSSKEEPRWFMVDIQLERKFESAIALTELKKTDGLESMALLKRGNRLSIQPVSEDEFQIIESMG